MNNAMVQPVQERDNLDLLELVCQLNSRYTLYGTQELHNMYWEARRELELRLSKKSELEAMLGENHSVLEMLQLHGGDPRVILPVAERIKSIIKQLIELNEKLQKNNESTVPSV